MLEEVGESSGRCPRKVSARSSYSSNVELCVASWASFCSSGVLEDSAHSMPRVTAQTENNSERCLIVPSLVTICGISDILGLSITLPPARSFPNKTMIPFTGREDCTQITTGTVLDYILKILCNGTLIVPSSTPCSNTLSPVSDLSEKGKTLPSTRDWDARIS